MLEIGDAIMDNARVPWLRIMVCLLVGAASTILASIAVRPLTNQWAGPRIVTSDEVAWWRSHAPALFPEEPGENFVNQSLGYRMDMLGWPARSLTAAPPFSAFRTRTGLPWPAFESEDWRAAAPLTNKSAGWLHLPWLCVTVPARPLPVGFIANTLVFALAAALLFESIRQTRRARRVHRGRCAACAYPVGEAERCSECGTAIPACARSEDRAIGFLPWLWRHRRLHAMMRMLALGAILTAVTSVMLAVNAPRRMSTLEAAEAGGKDRAADVAWFHAHAPLLDLDEPIRTYQIRSIGCERLAVTTRTSGLGTRIHRYRAGWPLHALEGVDWTGMSHLPPMGRPYASHSTIFFARDIMPVAVPLRPMAVGFILNSFFFAAILAGYAWLRLRWSRAYFRDERPTAYPSTAA